MYQLMSAFLSSCTQQIVCGGAFYSRSFEWCSTCRGLYWGLIYIIDNICLYADDCILHRKIESQADLRILQEFSRI